MVKYKLCKSLYRNNIKKVILEKTSDNKIGIIIGGGAPYCPCLYVISVTKEKPAAIEGSIEAGDEIIEINQISVEGMTKHGVADMIFKLNVNL